MARNGGRGVPGLTAVILVAAIAVAACGSQAGGTSSTRPGCHQYCLNAGSIGGGFSRVMTTVLVSRIKVLHDGNVPVTLRCDYTADCAGALLIGDDDPISLHNPCRQVNAVQGARTAGWWAQSDLSVSAGAARTIGMSLSSCARQLLAQKGTLRAVVTAETAKEIPYNEQAVWDGEVTTPVTLISP
jgi:hypothetical protein